MKENEEENDKYIIKHTSARSESLAGTGYAFLLLLGL
jgi:hypothetical protein